MAGAAEELKGNGMTASLSKAGTWFPNLLSLCSPRMGTHGCLGRTKRGGGQAHISVGCPELGGEKGMGLVDVPSLGRGIQIELCMTLERPCGAQAVTVLPSLTKAIHRRGLTF